MKRLLLKSLLGDIQLGEEQSQGNLTIIPLLGEDGNPPPFLIMDEAMEKKMVEVKEVGGGVVPELTVLNKSKRDLLLILGEELLGAKQNRTVNVSMVVPTKASLRIPVSCTEKGRWREGKGGLKMKNTSDHYSYSTLRQNIMTSVSETVKVKGSYKSDQMRVWDSISRSLSSMDISSRTDSQSDLFKGKKGEIESQVERFTLLDNQLGMIGIINNEVKGLDLFGWEDTMAKMFTKLLRSYVIESIASSSGFEGARGKHLDDFLEDLRLARVERCADTGKGEHFIIEGKWQRGMALRVEEKLCHLFSAPWMK
jgi:hypothetical protein